MTPDRLTPDKLLEHFNVTPDHFAMIEDQYRASSSIRTKYARSFPTHIEKNIDRALALNLDQGRSKHILDIGSGCCYFPAIAAYFGHTTLSTDVDPDAPIFADISALFGQRMRELWVRPHEKLPDDVAGFDLITAFATCFNMYGLGTDKITHWDVPEWTFLLSDLQDRLTDDGKLVFDINKDTNADTGMAPELHHWFNTLENADLQDTGGYYRLIVSAS